MRLYHLVKSHLLAIFKIKTIGARALVIRDDHVLLVKHTYRPKWYTIGGSVDRGETPLQAITRELKEEVGAKLNDQPKLFSVYHSNIEKRDDYIIFYVAEACEFEEVTSPEILEKKWFSLNDLPEDISPATLRRINEYLGKIPISDTW